MPAKPPPSAGRLIGYARVSTEEQDTDPQLDELRAAGCVTILQEHASRASRSRPVLARLIRDLDSAETLVVVGLDRLARSVSHLLAVIEPPEGSGAHSRSLHDHGSSKDWEAVASRPSRPMARSRGNRMLSAEYAAIAIRQLAGELNGRAVTGLG